MSTNNEYIDITTLNMDNMTGNEECLLIDKNVHNAKDMKQIYQIQAQKGNTYVNIMHVGNFTETPSISIQQFNRKKLKFKVIANCFSLEEIDKIDNCKLDMITAYIMTKSDKILGTISSVFYTFIHRHEKQPLNKYLSTESNLKNVPGFFAVVLEYVILENSQHIKKSLLLERFTEFPGKTMIIHNVMKYLFQDDIIGLIPK